MVVLSKSMGPESANVLTYLISCPRFLVMLCPTCGIGLLSLSARQRPVLAWDDFPWISHEFQGRLSEVPWIDEDLQTDVRRE